MVTGSKELIRDINSRLVLTTILNEGPVSRASMAKKLGLTKATISTIVQSLIDHSFVKEIGSDDTTRGRKPILLRFLQQSGYIISLDLGVHTITVLTADLMGQHCTLKQYQNHSGSQEIILFLTKVLTEAMTTIPQSIYGVVGICIGIHGTVYQNEVSFTPYYPYAGVPFAKDLERYFHIPVYLENEANLSVLGEKTFCYNHKNMAGISVHAGIGLGLMVNNSLYSGFNGYAGEFGHSIIEMDGRPCPCGNYGCLEQYASERALLMDFAHRRGSGTATIDEFVLAYQNHNKHALYIMDQFVKYMAVGINNILNTFNPDVIVINSSFTIYFPGIIDRIRENLKNHMQTYCNLVPSGLQDTSILLGGACVSIKNFLNIDYLQLDKDML